MSTPATVPPPPSLAVDPHESSCVSPTSSRVTSSEDAAFSITESHSEIMAGVGSESNVLRRAPPKETIHTPNMPFVMTDSVPQLCEVAEGGIARSTTLPLRSPDLVSNMSLDLYNSPMTASSPAVFLLQSSSDISPTLPKKVRSFCSRSNLSANSDKFKEECILNLQEELKQKEDACMQAMAKAKKSANALKSIQNHAEEMEVKVTESEAMLVRVKSELQQERIKFRHKLSELANRLESSECERHRLERGFKEKERLMEKKLQDQFDLNLEVCQDNDKYKTEKTFLEKQILELKQRHASDFENMHSWYEKQIMQQQMEIQERIEREERIQVRECTCSNSVHSSALYLELENLHNERDQLRVERDIFENLSVSVRREKEEALTEIGIFREQISSLKTEKDNALMEIGVLRNQNSDLRNGYEDALKKIGILCDQNSSLEKEKQDALKKIGILCDQNSSLEKEKQDALKEIGVLRDQYSSLEKEKQDTLKEIGVLRDQNSSLVKEKQDALQEIGVLRDQNVSLKEEKEDAVTETCILRNQNVILTKEKEDALMERDVLRNQNVILTKEKEDAVMERDVFYDVNSNLRSELDVAQSEIEMLQNQHIIFKKEKDDAYTERDVFQEHSVCIRRELEEMTAERNTLCDQNAKLALRLEALEAEDPMEASALPDDYHVPIECKVLSSPPENVNTSWPADFCFSKERKVPESDPILCQRQHALVQGVESTQPSLNIGFALEHGPDVECGHPFPKSTEITRSELMTQDRPVVEHRLVLEDEPALETEPVVGRSQVLENQKAVKTEPVELSRVLEDEQILETEPVAEHERVLVDKQALVTEPVGERSRVLEDEQILETELEVERSRVLEDEQAPEPEPVVELSRVLADEQAVETDPVGERSRILEDEQAVETEPEVERSRILEDEQAVETEPEVERSRILEDEQALETEPVAQHERVLETEHALETVQPKISAQIGDFLDNSSCDVPSPGDVMVEDNENYSACRKMILSPPLKSFDVQTVASEFDSTGVSDDTATSNETLVPDQYNCVIRSGPSMVPECDVLSLDHNSCVTQNGALEGNSFVTQMSTSLADSVVPMICYSQPTSCDRGTSTVVSDEYIVLHALIASTINEIKKVTSDNASVVRDTLEEIEGVSVVQTELRQVSYIMTQTCQAIITWFEDLRVEGKRLEAKLDLSLISEGLLAKKDMPLSKPATQTADNEENMNPFSLEIHSAITEMKHVLQVFEISNELLSKKNKALTETSHCLQMKVQSFEEVVSQLNNEMALAKEILCKHGPSNDECLTDVARNISDQFSSLEEEVQDCRVSKRQLKNEVERLIGTVESVNGILVAEREQHQAIIDKMVSQNEAEVKRIQRNACEVQENLEKQNVIQRKQLEEMTVEREELGKQRDMKIRQLEQLTMEIKELEVRRKSEKEQREKEVRDELEKRAIQSASELKKQQDDALFKLAKMQADLNEVIAEKDRNLMCSEEMLMKTQKQCDLMRLLYEKAVQDEKFLLDEMTFLLGMVRESVSVSAQDVNSRNGLRTPTQFGESSALERTPENTPPVDSSLIEDRKFLLLKELKREILKVLQRLEREEFQLALSVETAKKTITDLDDKFRLCDSEVDELLESVSSVQASVTQMHAETETFIDHSATLEAQLHLKDEECDGLKTSLEDKAGVVEELEQLAKKLKMNAGHSEQLLDMKKAALDALQKTLLDVEQKRDLLLEDLAKKNRKLETASTNVRLYRRNLRTLQEALLRRRQVFSATLRRGHSCVLPPVCCCVCRCVVVCAGVLCVQVCCVCRCVVCAGMPDPHRMYDASHHPAVC
ncbi:hypothetical protein FHG87_012699 [Trinorchestia longiramus]|nr:hypothetical protein FHG87_012699 [Trinorchestia longiramus]